MFAVARPMKNGALCTSLDSPVAGGSVVELVGLEPTTKVLWNMVRVRPTARINGKTTTPTIWMGVTRVVGRTRTMFHNTLVVNSSIRKPGKSSKTAKTPGDLHGCPTRGVGRTRTMFHNTLVVGSSPTSSTTQSRETGL